MNQCMPDTRMLEDIVQRLLCDVVQLLFDRAGQLVWILKTVYLQLRVRSTTCLDRVQPRLQRGHKSNLLQSEGAQLKNQESHLTQRFLSRVAQFTQVLDGGRGITAVEQPRGCFSIHGHAVQ